MIASVVNRNLGSHGGSSRVCASVLHLLRTKGYGVRVITKTPVNWASFSKWSGWNMMVQARELDPFGFSLFGKYEKFTAFLPTIMEPCDIFVNTSGDFFPFLFRPRTTNITYCHFPVVGLVTADRVPRKYASGPWRAYYTPYAEILNHLIRRAGEESVFLANSRFTMDNVQKYLGIRSEVIYPPVDVDRFRRVSGSERRTDSVVTVARFDPSKMLEHIFEVLKKLPPGLDWHIIGSVSRANASYFERFAERARAYPNLHLHPNAGRDELLALFSQSSVYFHPTRGEHFGISIVEAMAAGLVPVVWDYGGSTEFVPSQWQFSRVEDAADRIRAGFGVGKEERVLLSESTVRFSNERFEEEVGNIIERAIAAR